jgi:hypothetical protein
MFTPTPAFGPGKPTSQSRGKFTEIPHFAYLFVNLGIPMTNASSPEIALYYDGSGHTFFAPLRLCVRLYWRSVSTGHGREIAATGGCPTPKRRKVPHPVPGRNYFAFNSGDVVDGALLS